MHALYIYIGIYISPTLTSLILQEVTEGHKVEIVGFGSFSSHHRAARPGRNPKTGQDLDIEDRRTVPSFTAAKNFRDRVNE